MRDRRDIIAEHHAKSNEIVDWESAMMAGEDWFVFMNHGYAPENDEKFPTLNEEDQKWQHQAFMYGHLVNLAGTDPFGLDLLDVGCGRGGGASFLKRYYDLNRVVGLDLNRHQVAFCSRRHDRVEFVQATGIELPFRDSSFDLVTNVESSHCYPFMEQFWQEAIRILSPGGLLLYADICTGPQSYFLPRYLAKSGLALSVAEDITENVRKACSLDRDRFQRVFDSSKAEYVIRVAASAEELYALPDSCYVACVLRKRRRPLHAIRQGLRSLMRRA